MRVLTDIPRAEKKGRKGISVCSPKGTRVLLLSEEVGRAAGGEAVRSCEVWNEKIRKRGLMRKDS